MVVEEGSIVRYYEGGFYSVVAIGTHQEYSHHSLVVYKSLLDGKVFVSSIEQFVSNVSVVHRKLLDSVRSSDNFIVELDNMLGYPVGDFMRRLLSSIEFSNDELMLISRFFNLEYSDLKTLQDRGIVPKFAVVASPPVNIEQFKKENLI